LIPMYLSSCQCTKSHVPRPYVLCIDLSYLRVYGSLQTQLTSSHHSKRAEGGGEGYEKWFYVIAFRCHTSSLLSNTDGQAVRSEVLLVSRRISGHCISSLFCIHKKTPDVGQATLTQMHTQEKTFSDLLLPLVIGLNCNYSVSCFLTRT
jgi:hypothetical protein